MAHKRLRKDTHQIRAYKYAAFFKEQHDGRLPTAVYATAKRQQDLWNNFVTLLEASWETVKAGYADMDKKAKATYWSNMDDQCLAATKAAIANGLLWATGEATLDSYRAAIKRLGKGGGVPRMHYGLKSFAITHRFGGGGQPLDFLTSERGGRVRFIFPPDEVYEENTQKNRRARFVSAWFRVDEENTIGLNTIVHRPIPPGAIVKSAKLVGFKQSLVMPWQISLVITVEEPMPAQPETCRVFAIDVGWRKLGKKIRIAMGYDGKEHTDYRLPISYHKKGLGEVSIDRMNSLCEFRASKQNEVKAQLATVQPELAANKQAWERTGRRGLWKLMAGQTEGSPIRPAIEKWMQTDTLLLRQQLMLENAFNGRREWIYKNLAAQLVRDYDVIGIEDLDLIDMQARENHKGPANKGLRMASQRRKYAAVGSLFSAIRLAAQRTGKRVIAVPPRGTTHTCAECGEYFDTGLGGKLGICPNGHEGDRDENGSKNVYARAVALLQQEKGLRKAAQAGM